MPRSAMVPAPEPGQERALRTRQRQRLIDACISALYEHGPSRTTIDKVVSIAGMSPGIVNFYFDTKAALMVAALEFLAGEFDQEVMAPVSALRETPEAALETLIGLYLDPHLASARKVSVWYAFWGESSSRREYADICASRDDRFAALVLDLVARLIAQTGRTRMDADGVALGLIGALEVLWQGIAFQQEIDVDRAGGRRRCKAYLNAVFPGLFAPGVPRAIIAADADLPAWAYEDGALFQAERALVFFASWQFVCLSGQVSHVGDHVALDMLGDRAFAMRCRDGSVRAFRNTCLRSPHALTGGAAGRFADGIVCAVDGTDYGTEGAGLGMLPCAVAHGLVFVQFGAGAGAAGVPDGFGELPVMPDSGFGDMVVDADWKLVVELCLDWHPDIAFRQPNLLYVAAGQDCMVLQVIPVSAGHCRLRHAHAGTALLDVAAFGRVAASTQAGVVGPGALPRGRPSVAVVRFRHWLRDVLPGLRQTK